MNNGRGILPTINYPKDIKGLDRNQLKQLAEEIRHFLINSISKTGGHLAPNLGVVELTIALHKIFNMPEDKIIWDVGHQAYVHKILTGRKEKFDTLRKYEGLSGYPKPSESEYDVFGVGHSSTSISAGLGIARGRDLRKEKYHVVSVIGDGSLTGGMALEALNDAGASKAKMIVILNDNEMSISHNVGSLSKYLNKARSYPKYINIKKSIEYLLKKVPAVGDNLYKAADRVKDGLKHTLIEGGLFEDLGFTYLGPIDGHSIEDMMNIFNRAKTINKPVLIHVLTKKGKGYYPAEKSPDIFHGIDPFNVKTGTKLTPSQLSYSKAFGEEMTKEALDNEKIVAITAAMRDGTGLTNFAKKFPQRFFDVGIAEQHAVTLAAGLAINGLRPVLAIYSTFLQRGYDQVIHDICLQKLPIVLAIDRAGIVGEDGETHNGVFDISYLRSIPNIAILSPKDINEFKMMIKWCLSSTSPTAIRYPRGGDELGFNEYSDINMGKWETVVEGKDVAILAVGKMVQKSSIALEKLKSKGVNPTLVNCRFIKPLDEIMLDNMFDKYRLIITIEDNCIHGGFGSSVLEYSSMKDYEGKVKLLGYPDEFIPHGAVDDIYKKYKLDSEGIFNTIYNILIV